METTLKIALRSRRNAYKALSCSSMGNTAGLFSSAFNGHLGANGGKNNALQAYDPKSDFEVIRPGQRKI
jgi:hypothetical protein